MVEGKELGMAFQHRQYVFRRKVFRIFGGAFHVYDESGNVVFFSEQKAFKLKEDFRVYSDESKSRELLTIKTPRILDISATYNVRDATTGDDVGAIKRKGIKAILKDEWIFLSKEGREIGKLAETSLLGALLSRFINLIPQKYIITTPDGGEVAVIRQHFNPFILKYTMEFLETVPSIDPRLLVCAGVLLAGIEQRQK